MSLKRSRTQIIAVQSCYTPLFYWPQLNAENHSYAYLMLISYAYLNLTTMKNGCETHLTYITPSDMSLRSAKLQTLEQDHVSLLIFSFYLGDIALSLFMLCSFLFFSKIVVTLKMTQ